MRLHVNNLALTLMLTLFFFGGTIGFAQNRTGYSPTPGVPNSGFRMLNDMRSCNPGPYPGAPVVPSSCIPETNFSVIHRAVERENALQREPEKSATYQELLQRQRNRAAQEEEIRSRDDFQWYKESDPEVHANPEAPDQSELLKNSKDRDFILRNFRTMYVDAHDARYFSNALMKAALGKNPEFQKLNIKIVDDPSVADAVLRVSYTFAWEYPFELMHRNTTIVLLSGKGEGPFSGPLGAADVARNLVNAAKPWREQKKNPTTDKH